MKMKVKHGHECYAVSIVVAGKGRHFIVEYEEQFHEVMKRLGMVGMD